MSDSFAASSRTTPVSAPAESDVVLRNGATVRLRSIRPTDTASVEQLHRRLSPESLYFRFLGSPGSDAAARKAAWICGADGLNQVVLVVESGDRIVATAGYYVEPKRAGRAEVAFTVEDAVQGQGVGTRLLERLAEIARERGISTFVADVHPQNRRMLEVFRNCGFAVEQRVEEGVVRVIISLEATPAFQERAAERSARAAAASMKKLFEPTSVAVVGAARKRGKIGAEILHNLIAAKFRGKVYPVNPRASRIAGRRCYASVSEIPGPVDLAVLSIPAPAVEAAVDDCLAKGVQGLVIISAGFGETGEDGRRREAAILEKVRGAGIRMVGPNCMGLVNTDPRVRLNATFAPVQPPAGRVALSSQSGALGIALLDHARRLNLGISTFVSVGNKADVSGNDLVQYWAEDPRTDVILLYLESFGSAGLFARLARRVARRKPIVAVKAGRSRAGARAASSHTGALAESDTVVDALFRQAGVIRTDTLEEFFDVATLLAHQPVPRGRRVAILTNAGGPGILAADACEAHGLTIAPLDPSTREKLAAGLPREAGLGNPIDMLASASAEQYRRCLSLLLEDKQVDAALAIFIPPIVTGAEEVARAIVRAAGSTPAKPVLATFLGEEGAPPSLGRIPSYPFPERAAVALARAASYGEWRREPPGRVPRFSDVEPERGRESIDAALARGGGWLGPQETEALLSSFGIRVAPTRLARDEREAVEAARTLGFPVVLKAVGPTIVHKTEVGGVRLDLSGEASVSAAFSELSHRLGSAMTAALVQKQVPGGVEVIVGATFDPRFGPLVLYGSGGTLVELVADIAFRLRPLTDADAAAMLDEVRGTARLRGWRGAPPADEAALRDLILRVSALTEACPEVREMDLNPVSVLSRGAVVLDARIRVDRRPPPPASRRIAY
ncbi:MAG TPA: GNAT family N-acetyltransferase [Thermoanaerobaculia bacterium]|nr:GNAT family N-acetyltransferase [Thermoanaerobaculia bacterium]